MALTTEEIATYTQRLSEAEDAYHKIALGGQPKVYVDQNGERVEYQMANLDRLRSYIHSLRLALGKTTTTGPLTVFM